MHAEVDEAAAARQLRVPKPAAPRGVGSVEGDGGGKDAAKIAGVNSLTDRLHRRGVAVGQVHAEQPVGSPCGVEHGLDFPAIAAERLLTEDRCASGECFEAL